ncbi:T9SS type A sorting domain-containing protein [candidate division GN15 bacterium]|nr:T9SS type A sorting domain-containing protein [candidate division GN15 bacterium]
MKRLGSFLAILAFVYLAAAGSATADPEWVPQLTVPEDSTVVFCEPDSICFEVLGFDEDVDDSLKLTIIQPDGTRLYEQYDTNSIARTICFQPDTAGTYTWWFRLRDRHDRWVADTVNYTVTFNEPPTIVCPEPQTFYSCDVDTFCFEVDAMDPEFGELTWSVISGNATIDGQTVCVVGGEDAQFDVMVEVVDECGHADTCAVPVTIQGNRPPTVSLPEDFSITLCNGEEICIPNSYADDQDFDLESVYTNIGSYDDAGDRVCFTADTSGIYTIILTAVDSCGAMAEDTIQVTATVTDPPVVDLGGDRTVTLCDTAEICLEDITISGDEITMLNVSLGSYDAEAGTICFTPDTSGVYTLEVFLRDGCEREASDTIAITVELNAPPMISDFNDLEIHLCSPEQVCLEPTIFDPDNDIVSIVPSLGQWEDGKVCFFPYAKGEYEIVLTVTDNCGNVVEDTAYVTVTTDQGLEISCPGDTTVFLCETDTLRFPIEGIPAGAEVTVGGTNVNWDPETNSAWFVSDCCIENEITVEVATECETLTCSFMVYVETNSAPLVTLPPDTALFACDPLDICIPVGISDIDDNIASIDLTGPEGIYYDDYAGTICFAADTAGVYSIAVTVTDECGETRTRGSIVTVGLNEPPVIAASTTDTTVVQCEPAEICLPIEFSDLNDNIVDISTSLGELTIFPEGGFGEVCFMPEMLGESYTIVLTATDECGVIDSTTVTVNVEEAPSTEIACPIVEPAFLCDTATLFIPVEITGYTEDITVSYGEWVDGELSFFADTSGTYEIEIIANADCNSDTCVVTVQVDITDPVEIACPDDTSLFFCDSPQQIAIPLSITGMPDEVTVSPASATLENDTLYFDVSESGDYSFEIIAANSCNTDTCRFTATVNFNMPPDIILANDTTVTVCELPIDIYFPYQVINPDDGLIEVRTSLGIVNDSTIRFGADTAGVYTMIVSATDDCGLLAEDTANITVVLGDQVAIECPIDPFDVLVNVPETVRIPLPISPVDADVTVSDGGSYDVETGELVLPLDEFGIQTFTVTASTECGEATCDVVVNAIEYFPPMVFCPEDVDTALCFTDGPQTICLPVTVSGDYTDVIVDPIGQFLDGQVCIPIDSLGTYQINVRALNDRDTADCSFTLTNREGELPIISGGGTFEEQLCGPETVCYPVTITAGDFPIENVAVSYGNLADGQLCLPLDTTGVYTATVTVTDSCGEAVSAEFAVTAVVNTAPVVVLPEDSTILQCGPTEEVCVDVDITDENLVSVTSNLGTYDAEAGTICFAPDGAGEYELIVTAVDQCEESTTDTMTVLIEANTAPSVSIVPADTTVYLCTPSQICLDVEVIDLDGDLESVTSSLGQYADGQVCFFPYSAGTYEITVTATDICGAQSSATAVVTVETDQDIQLSCPGDTTVFLCEPDTLRFPIDGIPAGAEITVGGTNVNWDPETNEAWFFSDCCIENTITVTATTECGSHTCEFTVYVQTNSRPLVTLPADTAIVQCEIEDICVPVGISDIDGNLSSVELNSDIFMYDDYTGTVCFTPDSAGLYTLAVTAIDDCGAERTTDMNITVVTNSAPTVMFDEGPSEFKLCDLEQICLPISIDDPELNITSIDISEEGAVFNGESGEICFAPSAYGEICVGVTATDACGLSATDTLCIQVLPGDSVHIVCPEDSLFTSPLCGPGEACVSLEVVGDNFTVESSLGSWEDGRLCFPADTSGVYEITVTATAQCNADQCVVTVPVNIVEPITLTCPDNATEFLCGPDTLCYEFEVSDNYDAIWITGAYSDAYIEGTTVCVPTLEPGTESVVIAAANYCDTALCTFEVTSTFNSAPVVVEQQDIQMVECSLFTVCLPYAVEDVDENIVEITGPAFGEITDSGFCFTPGQFGSYEIIIVATDECGAADTGSYSFTISEGEYASISCPDDPFVSICGPSTVCVPVMIEPAGAEVTILPESYNGTYDFEQQTVCLDIDDGGAHPITVIAAAQCATDTCEFTINVDLQEPPSLTCPEPIDTLLCLAEPTELCFPIGVEGTGVEITSILPAGEYSAGQVCVPIDTAGTYEFEITATGACGTDVCTAMVTVTADEEPVFTMPEFMSFERCPEDTEAICITGFAATDTESDVTISKTCGPGDFDQAAGELCFVPDSLGIHEFCFEVTDGCHTVTATYEVDITLKPDCDVCVRLSIQGSDCSPVGLRTTVAVNIETNDEIGGYDLLLAYDASALTFAGATTEGTASEDWEYFRYSLNNGACGGACPSGLVRFIGIADQNDGPNHPPGDAFEPQGTLLYMDYLIANDQNLGDNFVPIRFVWYDCGDNSVSNRTGQILFIDLRIFNAENVLIWDETDDVAYPESERPFGMGAEDGCLELGDKEEPLRCIEFINGGVCIIDPEEIDDRGDVNMNSIAYEIGDVVTLTNYFIYGLQAFTISIPGQTAASDVNADGLTLTVAALTYLIRVVIGDAPPIPRVNPYAEELIVATGGSDGQVVVTTEAVSTVGAIHLVYEIPDGLTVSEPMLASGAQGMTLDYAIGDNELRMLIYDIGSERINSGVQEIVTIPVSGDGALNLTDAEAADYDGRPYTTLKGSSLPEGFALQQNYPNPFNPSTTISFDLPVSVTWRLELYNVTGSQVRVFEGSGNAGSTSVVWDGCNEKGEQVASGVYLYRLQAGSFSETKKMMLLK